MLFKYQNLFTNYLEQNQQKEEPIGLYSPITYILSLGGKRLRPILTLIATKAFGGDVKDSLAAALSVEFFHNFTLMHDDIMDALWTSLEGSRPARLKTLNDVKKDSKIKKVLDWMIQ